MQFHFKAAKPIPTISVQSLTGCAGELLVILENLQKMLPYVRIQSFPFAQSTNDNGPVDITFLEGSVSNPHDLKKLKAIRERSRRIVAVGNCAVWGCVQKGGCSRLAVEEMRKKVYGAQSNIEVMPASRLEDHVKVDVKLSGCPIDSTQLLAVTASLLKDHLPYVTQKPVCLECKLRENPCILIEQDLPCLGPVTAAGCGALCPSVGAPCYGCWGPSEEPQIDAMAHVLMEKGFTLTDILTRLQAFGAPPELFERLNELQDLANPAIRGK
jgi:coenzyme F420-reducing hydrogenase gamma subunit